jgi:heme exporter protein B
MSAIAATFEREFRLSWAGGGALAPLGFFLGVTVLVPLAMGPERVLLEVAGLPLVWVALALAILTTLERLFQADLEDGSLDQMLLSQAPLEALVLAKGTAHWSVFGAPLALAGAPAALALQAPPERIVLIVASLAIGGLAFVGAGLVAAAVTAGVRRGGVLIALIVLPFFAPPIIFGAAAAQGQDVAAALMVLGGCALGYLVLGVLAAVAALRVLAE